MSSRPVRGALHMKKARRHAGTLDPMATGVLVVGFGNATRLLNYIVDHDKTYLATIDSASAPPRTTPMANCCRRRAGKAPHCPSRRAVEDASRHHFAGAHRAGVRLSPHWNHFCRNGQAPMIWPGQGKDVDLKARPVTISEFSVPAVRYGNASTTCAGSPLADAVEIAPEGILASPKPTGKTNRTCSQSWNSTWP